jgi:hypothetical protein
MRSGLGQVLKQRQHLPEHPRPRLPRIPPDPRLAQFRHQPGQLPRTTAGQQGRDAVSAQVADKLPQHPGERRERQALRPQVQAVPGQDPDRTRGPRPELTGQP